MTCSSLFEGIFALKYPTSCILIRRMYCTVVFRKRSARSFNIMSTKARRFYLSPMSSISSERRSRMSRRCRYSIPTTFVLYGSTRPPTLVSACPSILDFTNFGADSEMLRRWVLSGCAHIIDLFITGLVIDARSISPFRQLRTHTSGAGTIQTNAPVGMRSRTPSTRLPRGRLAQQLGLWVLF